MWDVEFLELGADDAFNARFRHEAAFVEIIADVVLEKWRIRLSRCHIHGADLERLAVARSARLRPW
jgi:hypothetical protein